MNKPISKLHKQLGRKIQQIRAKKKMTQEDLAFKVGVDRSYLGFVEKGGRNPTLDKIGKFPKHSK